jgi:sulfate adenylyltransferase subunit 2
MADITTALLEGAPSPWRQEPELPLYSRNGRLNHLRALEAESIYILREAAAEFARPVMLYSIGKDSSVMLRLAQKAFYPGKIPFPLLHIDTSYKFPEMIEFRDR